MLLPRIEQRPRPRGVSSSLAGCAARAGRASSLRTVSAVPSDRLRPRCLSMSPLRSRLDHSTVHLMPSGKISSPVRGTASVSNGEAWLGPGVWRAEARARPVAQISPAAQPRRYRRCSD